MADAPVVIYSTPERAPLLRQVLAAGCRAVGTTRAARAAGDGQPVPSPARRAQPAARGPDREQRPVHGAGGGARRVPRRASAGTSGARRRRGGLAPSGLALGRLRAAAVRARRLTAGDGCRRSGRSRRGATGDGRPGRSEAGVMLQLLLLDRSRHGDKDDPWALWTTRAAQHRLLLRDRPETAFAALGDGLASHALVPGDAAAPYQLRATPLRGLAPLPNAIGAGDERAARGVGAGAPRLDARAGCGGVFQRLLNLAGRGRRHHRRLRSRLDLLAIPQCSAGMARSRPFSAKILGKIRAGARGAGPGGG